MNNFHIEVKEIDDDSVREYHYKTIKKYGDEYSLGDKTKIKEADVDDFRQDFNLSSEHIDVIDDLFMAYPFYDNTTEFYVAGGYFRRWIEKQRVVNDGDIDIFVVKGDVFNVYEYVNSNFNIVNWFKNNSILIEKNGLYLKIQFVRNIHNISNASDLINSFDFICNMFSYNATTRTLYYEMFAPKHVQEKKLHFNYNCDSMNATNLFKRYKKFLDMGYTISDIQLNKMMIKITNDPGILLKTVNYI